MTIDNDKLNKAADKLAEDAEIDKATAIVALRELCVLYPYDLEEQTA